MRKKTVYSFAFIMIYLCLLPLLVKLCISNITYNHNHVLYQLLPPISDAYHNATIYGRVHTIDHIIDCNFTNRVLYCNSY